MNFYPNRPGKPGDKLCVVCGARTAYHNDTCDTTCTRAKRNGLTRGRQLFHDTRRAARIRISETRWMDRHVGESTLHIDVIHYNRPYLAHSYAA